MMKLTATDIMRIQRILHLAPTGVVDPLTEAAVRNYQLKSDLPATGEIDNATKDAMLGATEHMDTDLSDRYASKIQEYYLPKGEYVESATKKEYLFLHHTAGWNNPYKVVDMWATDTRGRIGTHFIIGGINPKTGDDTYDGLILKCFDEEYYAWHLGQVDQYMHKHSIGIELCNFGYLTKKSNSFYTYAGTVVDPDQVVDLGYTFRGYRYWQKYSDKQLSSLVDLITYLTEKHSISTYIGLKERLSSMSPKDAFEYFEEAVHGEVKGILSHTSVRKDKFDVFPQENLIDLILNL